MSEVQAPGLLLQAYKEAIGVQGESNAAGIAIAMSGAVMAAKAELRAHYDSDLPAIYMPVGRHPIFVLFASKLHDLADLGVSYDTRYGMAYDHAIRVADGRYVLGTDECRDALRAYFDAYGNS